MSAIIGWVLSNPTFLAIVAGLIGALGWGFRQKRAGRQEERAKQAAERLKAKNIADEIDNDIGALPSGEAREEFKKWARKD